MGFFRVLLLSDDEVKEHRLGSVDSFSRIISEVDKKWNPPRSPLKLARRGVLSFLRYVVAPKDKGTFNSLGPGGSNRN